MLQKQCIVENIYIILWNTVEPVDSELFGQSKIVHYFHVVHYLTVDWDLWIHFSKLATGN